MLLVKILYRFILWLLGWKVEGKLSPDVKKYIIIIVPHTSNWDLPLGVLTRSSLGLTGAKFLAKKSIFDLPGGFVFKWLGGTPVDRNRKMKLVDQVVEKFNNSKKLGITITPEGTRSYIETWKTGFYHIALKARVPLVLAYMDYPRRVVGIRSEPFWPSGDYNADLHELYSFYADKVPRYPENSHIHRGKNCKGNTALSWPRLLLKLASVSVLLLLLLNFRLVGYGIKQGYGQLNILLKAQPVETYLQDPAWPDSLKQQIKLVQQVKQYAFDSLGIDYSDSYSKLYDQQGKPVLWVVTACRPFALENKEWHFPLLGSVSYKGFFDFEAASEEEAELAAEGWDTRLREVNGWSTLGILNDPILSNMLYRSPGSLAEVILHELTHGTIFVKSNLQLNESLASFVGEEGAVMFLKRHFGEHSTEYIEYVRSLSDYEIYSSYVLEFTVELQEVYASFPLQMDYQEKVARKNLAIQKFKQGLMKLPVQSERYKAFFKGLEPNNAYFMAYVRYRGTTNQFRQEFAAYNGDLKSYIADLKERHPSIFNLSQIF